MNTIDGSNGCRFKAVFRPFSVKIEAGMTTIYLTKEDKLSLKNDVKVRTAWWNSPYKAESEVI